MFPSCLWCYNFNHQKGLQSGTLLRFSVSNEGLSFVDGKLAKADLQYMGKVNRARTFADSYSKVDLKFFVFYH